MKIFVTGEEAKLKIKSGLDKVANAVKLTLGPSGRNAIIGRPYQNPLITNDGITIAREIELEDEIEQLGKEALDDALKSANDEAGDGTTTTTVLLQAITDEAFDRLKPKSSLVKNTIDPMAVRKEINEATDKAIKLLKTKARKITSLKDIQRVATISVESEELGSKIAKMFHELGKDALIQTLDSHTPEVVFETNKGLELAVGLPSHHFINSGNDFVSELPLILVTNQYLAFEGQIEKAIEIAVRSKRPLILISDNFSKELIALFAEEFKNVAIIPVKVPVFQDYELLKDYAQLLGARYFDTYDDLNTVDIKDCGTCEKITISKDKTIFVGTNGDTKERIETIKELIEKADTSFDKENLKKRIGKLRGAIGVIRVGSSTESEKEYLKLKIEDAVNATRNAMEEGVVKGGGLALKELADELDESIITKALRTPYEQIQKNSGGIEITDDVIDPLKVTRTALEKASSVAGIIITTEIAIADKREPKKDLSIDET